MARYARLALLAALSLAACGGHDGLTANGQVNASDATGSLGQFQFATDTKLYGDASAPPTGVMAGHCTIVRGTGGTPDKLDFGVMRTGMPGDLGLMQVRVQVDDVRPTSTHAIVTATFGSTTSTGDTYAAVPGTSCPLTFDYEPQDKVASFTLGTCAITGPGGTRQLTGSMTYFECTVE